MSGCPSDWIIEILSKSAAQKDLTDKFNLYQNAGVKEYWIVPPNKGTVLAYRLNDQGEYQPFRNTPFSAPEKVAVGIFPDFSVDLGEVFGND